LFTAISSNTELNKYTSAIFIFVSFAAACGICLIKIICKTNSFYSLLNDLIPSKNFHETVEIFNSGKFAVEVYNLSFRQDNGVPLPYVDLPAHILELTPDRNEVSIYKKDDIRACRLFRCQRRFGKGDIECKINIPRTVGGGKAFSVQSEHFLITTDNGGTGNCL